MSEAKRLPNPDGSPDYAAPLPPSGGLKAAEAWARWAAARDGITIPHGATFFRVDMRDIATVTEFHAVFKSRYYTGQLRSARNPTVIDGYEYTEEVSFEIPEHANPFNRCDLWHLAHQGGATATERYSAAMGWETSRNRDAVREASKPAKAVGKQANFDALLATPSNFVATIRAERARREALRIAEEAKWREANRKDFKLRVAQVEAREGEDGTRSYLDYGPGFDLACIARYARKEWMKAAREERSYSSEPDHSDVCDAVSYCVARARMFSRHVRMFNDSTHPYLSTIKDMAA